MTTSLQIWTDYYPTGPAADYLRPRLAAHTLLFQAQGATPADADIALGQPDPAAILAAPRLKWLHITSAGYTKFDFPQFWQALRARPAIITNSSAVFAEPCAQHALAMLLAFARALPWSLQNQFPVSSPPNPNPNPNPNPIASPTWQSTPIRKRSFLLTDQKILLLGYGAIAHRLAELLAPMTMTKNIVGLRRNPRGNEPIRIVPLTAAAPALSAADHIISTLPESPSTLNFCNVPFFAQLKPTAYFYNIGRGKTVDQPALIQSLTSGHLAGAYLDVTDPEPLPPTHPLWTTPNCFLTPHSAGGHQNERQRVLDHFLANLRSYEQGHPLADRIL
jgi:phosphoglycerate dehydrogenase-like enzyme